MSREGGREPSRPGQRVLTGGEARWEVEELLQELADGEPGGHVMETAGTTAEKKG